MTTKILNNEEMIIESVAATGMIRIAILDGDLKINEEGDLPKNKLLYYIDRVIVSGTGKIKYS